MRNALIALFLLLPGLALGASKEEDKLFAELAKAASAEEAQPIERKLGALFKVSGSPSVDLLMTRANAALQASDHATARKLLESVTKVAPRYAEGWRQRSQVQAAGGDDAGAMISLQKAVELNPRHFEAMADLGSMLEEYGDKPGALKLYRRVLALNPQLSGVSRRERILAREIEGQGI